MNDGAYNAKLHHLNVSSLHIYSKWKAPTNIPSMQSCREIQTIWYMHYYSTEQHTQLAVQPQIVTAEKKKIVHYNNNKKQQQQKTPN